MVFPPGVEMKWAHEGVDQSGIVVARDERYDEVDRAGQVRCGWRTYDASGCLIAQHTIPNSGSVQSRQQPRFAA